MFPASDSTTASGKKKEYRTIPPDSVTPPYFFSSNAPYPEKYRKGGSTIRDWAVRPSNANGSCAAASLASTVTIAPGTVVYHSVLGTRGNTIECKLTSKKFWKYSLN